MKRYKDLKTEQLAGALEEQLKGQLAQEEAQAAGAPSAEAAATGLSDKELFSFAGFDASEPSAAAIPTIPTGGRRSGCFSKTASPCSSSSSWF